MPVAQGPQIAVSVVITMKDVVDIGRQLAAADAIVEPGAVVVVSKKDATADG